MSDRPRVRPRPLNRPSSCPALCILAVGCCVLIGSAWAEQDADAWLVKGLVNETLELERTGAEVPWSNANTGNSGIIRVERTYYLADGTPCRDYVRTTKRWDGEESTNKGSGCRMANGRWFLDESDSNKAGSAPKESEGAAAEGPGRGDAGGSKAPEAAVETADARTADEEPGAKSAEAPAEQTEAWTPPPPPAKPRAPDFTLPSKSEL